jgi:hypothetical protein
MCALDGEHKERPTEAISFIHLLWLIGNVRELQSSGLRRGRALGQGIGRRMNAIRLQSLSVNLNRIRIRHDMDII